MLNSLQVSPFKEYLCNIASVSWVFFGLCLSGVLFVGYSAYLTKKWVPPVDDEIEGTKETTQEKSTKELESSL